MGFGFFGPYSVAIGAISEEEATRLWKKEIKRVQPTFRTL